LTDGRSKMSKSDPSELSRINLLDNADEIAKKIKRCKTDPIKGLVFDDPERPECNNLLTLYAILAGKSKESVAEECGDLGWGQFKPMLTEVAIESLRPIQEKYSQIRDEKSYLTSVLRSGRLKAEAVANQTLERVKNAMGYLPPD
jgi:tryptophanyl-tRNA synthetase